MKFLSSCLIICPFFIFVGCGSSGSSPSSCALTSNAKLKDYGKFLTPNLQDTTAELKQLHGHVLKAVGNGSLQDQGRLQTSQEASSEEAELNFTVSLQLNHREELNQRVSEIYTPGNANFHKFITAAEFHARYAPSSDQINQVKDYFSAQRIESLNVDPNGVLLHARGKISDLETSFHTEIHQYKNSEGSIYRAPAYELQVPQALSIEGVHGLQNFTQAHAHSAKSTKNILRGVHPRSSGTGPGGGLSPKDIINAYQVPEQVSQGQGQTLAVFELDSYYATDIAGYESYFSLPSVPLKNVSVDLASSTPGGGVAEVTLDIELMIALAPQAEQIIVYEGVNSEQGILDAYSQIASDNLAQSVSTSWGVAEDSSTAAFLQAENTIFTQMASQGQTIFSAAGDSGAYDDGSTLSVDDPAAQPFVTGVGGTRLTTNAQGAYASETTWNGGSITSGAGGGGVSGVWTQPSWQAGVASATNLASIKMRNVPDVALHADIDTGYSVYVNGSWSTWGGTSCAAPLWAAFTALVNQQRSVNGLSPIGFMNPTLYELGESTRYTQDFFDINDGSTNLYYPALTGYDDATGWGSFNGANLIQDLTATPSNLESFTPGQIIQANGSCS